MENRTHITVFGATGNIGSELIQLLSEANIPTTAVTRRLDKASELPGVHWIQADMSDRQSLTAAMQHSKAVFLLSGLSSGFVAEQSNVIGVAAKLGIPYVVKLSSGVADSRSSLRIPQVHGEVEDFLKSSGLQWTMLRPNGIMQNWLGEIAESVRRERKFSEATGDGKRAHVDRRDIAEVAFKCLIAPEQHAGNTYLLTSDEAVNYEQIAAAIGKAIGDTVTYVPISPEEARQDMKGHGTPDALIETFLAYDATQREGRAEVVTGHVRNILGRPARSLRQFVADYAHYFK